MSDREIQITYDTLIDLSRRERSKPELQKLDSTFYDDVIEYLKEKQEILSDMQTRSDQFSDQTQQQNTYDQLNNAKRLIKDIYDRRERKIIEMALNKSRTRSNIIDTSALLDEERHFFNSIARMLSNYRDSILESTLRRKKPQLIEPEDYGKTGEKTENSSALHKNSTGSDSEPSKQDRLVRFIHSVPKFVGSDMSVYGPYETEDVAKLSDDIARVLIEKGRAELIEESE